jgi:lambda repressor-like predicted transcriptional regulator
MNKKHLILIATLALAMLAVGATAVFAQTPDADPGGETPEAPFFGHGPRGFFGRGGSIDRESLLAEELGVTVEELQAARERAQATALEQAVEQGLITQEQADLMQAKSALQSYVDKESLMAVALGISVEELQAAIADGTTMPELLEEQGLNAATLRENMAAAREAAVQQAVEDGVISQELADQIQSAERGGFGFPGHGRRGHHGRGQGGQLLPDAPTGDA